MLNLVCLEERRMHRGSDGGKVEIISLPKGFGYRLSQMSGGGFTVLY